MGRVGNYDGDCDSNICYLWDSVHKRAREGKRGQAFLKELEVALLALPEKKLAYGAFCRDGEVCALGSVALKREMDAGASREEAMTLIQNELSEKEEFSDDMDFLEAAKDRLKMTGSLAYDVMEMNDRGKDGWTPEVRYQAVLDWVRKNLK